jgi:hypothetical protein
MRRAFAFLIVAATSAACVIAAIDYSGKPCPCPSGWSCSGGVCEQTMDGAAGPDRMAPGDASLDATADASRDASREASSCSPPGSTHEPAGMSKQIDTGCITAPAPASFTMISPAMMTSTGESSANLVRVPDGTGLRILYNLSLAGGNAPVRFGTPIKVPGSTTYYQRWRVRTVKNWAGPRNGQGVTMCQPQVLALGSGTDAGTNDMLTMSPSAYGTNSEMAPMEALQGPDGHYRNLGVNQGQVARLTDGSWHTDERIFVAESTAGAGDGQYYAYLDGSLVAKFTDVLWLAPGGTWGVHYFLVDPEFGGAPPTTHPLPGDFWDFDQLYVSTK